MHALLEETANDAHKQPYSIEQKIGDFYFSGMDVESINKLGLEPLKNEFDKINAIQDQSDLQNEIAHLHLIGIDVMFNFGGMTDFNNSEYTIGALSQGGLSLPDKDDYLKKDSKSQKLRRDYVNHVIKMFELSGQSHQSAMANAAAVMRIETQLARGFMSRETMRDPHAIYHMINIEQLKNTVPNFNWSNYFRLLGMNQMKNLNLATPDFFKALNQQLAKTSIHDWQAYLRWHLLDATAPFLSVPFVNENFKMVQNLTGIKNIPPRWKRVVVTENQALGFAIGEIYVKKNFSINDKKYLLTMIKNIQAVLKNDLQTLPWMTEETRKAALKKLATMKARVICPDKWWDYLL